MEMQIRGLKYHKVIKYVIFPFLLLFNLNGIFFLYDQLRITTDVWTILLELMAIIVQSILILLAYYGFSSRRTIGYYSILIMNGVNVLYKLFWIGVQANLKLGGFEDSVFVFISTLIYASIVVLYYRKRKYQLFDFNLEEIV